MTDGIGNLGGFNIHMVVSLIVAWVLVYFALFKGIRWTGKVQGNSGLPIIFSRLDRLFHGGVPLRNPSVITWPGGDPARSP